MVFTKEVESKGAVQPLKYKRFCREVFQPSGEFLMKKNVHPIERAVRIIAGLAILSLVFVGPKSLWGLLGIIPLTTGLLGWCLPYQLLGISTCKNNC